MNFSFQFPVFMRWFCSDWTLYMCIRSCFFVVAFVKKKYPAIIIYKVHRLSGNDAKKSVTWDMSQGMASRIACRKISSSENYVLGWISSQSCSYFLWNREFFKKENRPRPRLRVLLTPPRDGKMATRTWTYIKTSVLTLCMTNCAQWKFFMFTNTRTIAMKWSQSSTEAQGSI